MAGVNIRRGSALLCRELVRAIRPLWVVFLLLLPAVAQAQFTFTTNNGTITITRYTGPGGTVVIPDTTNGFPVTSIGANAFFYCTNLTSVTIPNSVTNIGMFAFTKCISLTSVTIGNGVTNIGDYAFEYCTSLTSVTIPNSVTSIGRVVFTYCSSLSSVTIGNGVISIGLGAFDSCTSLTSIMVDTNNPSYSSVAGVLFNKSQTLIIAYPAGLSGNYTIPNSVISIGDAAFYGCTSLTSVMIPNSVTSIGNWAFGFCTSLTNVTVPNSVTDIVNYAFSFCTSLTSIIVETNNPSYSSVAGVLFNKSQTVIMAFPGGLSGSYTIPNSVTSIGDPSIGEGVFSGCTNLTSVTIPNSVTSIVRYAFVNCYNLTTVFFLGNAPSGNSSVFNGESGTAYYLPGTTGWGSTFGGWPTALWYQPNPLILGSAYGLGTTTNGFGFTISWATNLPVVVEACTNLANPVWNPVATNPLAGGTSYFSDPQWTNYPGRFYRLRSP